MLVESIKYAFLRKYNTKVEAELISYDNTAYLYQNPPEWTMYYYYVAESGIEYNGHTLPFTASVLYSKKFMSPWIVGLILAVVIGSEFYAIFFKKIHKKKWLSGNEEKCISNPQRK